MARPSASLTRTRHAQAVCNARAETGLTQRELGRRIGLSGRAISRWEQGVGSSTRRNRAALVMAISLVNAEAGERLKAAFEAATPDAAPREVAPEPAPASHDVSVKLSLLALVHQLDVPVGRVRTALVQFCKELSRTQLTVDALGACVERALPEP